MREGAALPRPDLARLLMAAASELSEDPAAPAPAVLGLPVREGRLALGRLRPLVQRAADEPVAYAVGFGLACWLGPDPAAAPPLGRLWERGSLDVDRRGRVRLHRRVRAFLAVADPSRFDAVPVAVECGVLLVPVVGFDRRWEGFCRCS
jgi:hypothetical protein